MNFLDLIILIILVLFAISGYRKGIIIGLATIFALILGIYIAVHFSNFLDALLLEKLSPSREWLPILSFSFTFLLVVIAVIIIAHLTEKVADVVGLGFMNRLGGAFLGILKGIILISILQFLLHTADPKNHWITAKEKGASLSYNKISRVFPELMKMFGGEIKFPNWDKLDKMDQTEVKSLIFD
jgi:membrane protein required for colicin V production